MDELREMAVEIKKGASERGLVLFPGIPRWQTENERTHYPEVTWQGTWHQFLDLAARVGAKILYLVTLNFNFDSDLRSTLEADDYFDEPEFDADGNRNDRFWWAYQRLFERVSDWRPHDSKVLGIECWWLADGVVHEWDIQTEWFNEYARLIADIKRELSEAEMSEQRLRSTAATERLYGLGRELAGHERFPEASNEAKRQFMAEQFFPAETAVDQERIAEKASLIYWWDVGPAEHARKVERAQDMYERGGETIRHIATVLHLPEAKVREIVARRR